MFYANKSIGNFAFFFSRLFPSYGKFCCGHCLLGALFSKFKKFMMLTKAVITLLQALMWPLTFAQRQKK